MHITIKRSSLHCTCMHSTNTSNTYPAYNDFPPEFSRFNEKRKTVHRHCCCNRIYCMLWLEWHHRQQNMKIIYVGRITLEWASKSVVRYMNECVYGQHRFISFCGCCTNNDIIANSKIGIPCHKKTEMKKKWKEMAMAIAEAAATRVI